MTAITAIRSSQISGLGKVLGISANDKLSDSFHASGGAETHTSDTSAHISFHNAVKTIETEDRKKVTARVRARQRQWLEQEYKKAAKRAEKKGRTLPPKEDYFSQWGTNYTGERNPQPRFFNPWFASNAYSSVRALSFPPMVCTWVILRVGSIRRA